MTKTKNKTKTKVKKIKVCKHRWITSDSCGNCGYYEACCEKCDVIDLFSPSGKRQKMY